MDEQVAFQQAIAAARAGQKAEARRLLEQILQANPYHEQAWLWMSAVAETNAERVECLQRVLAINPDNAAARKGLAQLQARTAKPPAIPQPAASPPVAPCPHCGASNRAGARFCSGCGQRLGTMIEPSPLPPSPPQPVYPQSKVKPGLQPAKSKRGLWTAAAVLGVLMVCVIGGWLVSLGVQSMTGPQSSPEALAEAAIITFYSEGDAEKVIAWYSPDH